MSLDGHTDPKQGAATLVVADWAGDPYASVACARRQLERITELCVTAGLRVTSGEVGDPDPLSAIGDALGVVRVDEIVLFARGRHVAAGYPFSVARRAERLSGVRVTPVAVGPAPRPPRRRVFAGSRCAPTTPLVSP